MSAADSHLYPDNPELPVGTWSYQPGEFGSFQLWQQTESGPHYVGSVNSIASADFIVERLNDAHGPLSVAQGSQEGTPSAAGVWFSSLIESLRPFAYYFDLNDCEGRSDGDALEIPVSDLRAARDLLKKLGIDTSLPPWAPSLPSTERRPPRFPDAISPEPPENAQ